MTTVPVCCNCGWTGFRTVRSIKKRPCPACDGKVKRNRSLEQAARDIKRVKAQVLLPEPAIDTPLESYIAETYRPVDALPNPYHLRDFSGKIVQTLYIPPRLRKRPARKRRR